MWGAVLLRSCSLIPLVLAEALVEQSAVLSSLRWVSCHLAKWNVPGRQNLHGEKIKHLVSSKEQTEGKKS
jgi:hypothetical protein